MGSARAKPTSKAVPADASCSPAIPGVRRVAHTDGHNVTQAKRRQWHAVSRLQGGKVVFWSKHLLGDLDLPLHYRGKRRSAENGAAHAVTHPGPDSAFFRTNGSLSIGFTAVYSTVTIACWELFVWWKAWWKKCSNVHHPQLTREERTLVKQCSFKLQKDSSRVWRLG